MTEPIKSQSAYPTIALALGGGGARGLAHILMLEVLDEFGIRPKVIAGTSIGAMFGAAYAAGLGAAAIRAHTEEMLRTRFDLARQLFAARSQRLLGLLQLKSALLDPERLLDVLLPPGLPDDFDGLAIPLRVVAADFFRQEQVVLSSGPLKRAIAASIALPVLFSPILAGKRALMDGGLVNPLPFDVVSGEADLTIAVDVSGAPRNAGRTAPPSAFEAGVSASQILQHALVREKLRSRQPDIIISVEVNQYYVLEFHRIAEILAAAAPAQHALRVKLAALLEMDIPPRLRPAPLPRPAVTARRRRILGGRKAKDRA